MANTIKPTIETGAMTLVLLVTNYRSQMVALLLKNGVTVPSNASVQQIASLMANLLKISKTFAKDLNVFIQNPKVIQVLAGGIQQNAQFLKASGGNYMNFTDTSSLTDPDLPTNTANTPEKSTGFFSNLNLGDLLSKGLGAFGAYDKNKTDRAIADARAQVGSTVGSGSTTTEDSQDVTTDGKTKEDTGMGTTTIVVISLVSIAVLGTIVYFIVKAKK